MMFVSSTICVVSKEEIFLTQVSRIIPILSTIVQFCCFMKENDYLGQIHNIEHCFYPLVVKRQINNKVDERTATNQEQFIKSYKSFILINILCISLVLTRHVMAAASLETEFPGHALCLDIRIIIIIFIINILSYFLFRYFSSRITNFVCISSTFLLSTRHSMSGLKSSSKESSTYSQSSLNTNHREHNRGRTYSWPSTNILDEIIKPCL